MNVFSVLDTGVGHRDGQYLVPPYGILLIGERCQGIGVVILEH